MKKIIIFAGVNGAGKSTLHNLILNHCSIPYINPDRILKDMGGLWNSPADQFKAGKEAIRKRKELLDLNENFAFETTLSGNSALNFIEKAKAKNYRTIMYYIGVSSSDLAINRVLNRVQKGGHGIEDELIKERYYTSQQNLLKAANICDTIYVFDNTQKYNMIAKFECGILFKYKSVKWFDKLITMSSSKAILNEIKLEQSEQEKEQDYEF